jgi:hypothetical protein
MVSTDAEAPRYTSSMGMGQALLNAMYAGGSLAVIMSQNFVLESNERAEMV